MVSDEGMLELAALLSDVADGLVQDETRRKAQYELELEEERKAKRARLAAEDCSKRPWEGEVGPGPRAPGPGLGPGARGIRG